MTTPIVIIGGGAGSGKDTAAGFLIENRNGAIVSQADPMKRFAADLFDFSEEQLWGPSANRNAGDPRSLTTYFWDEADDAFLQLRLDQNQFRSQSVAEDMERSINPVYKFFGANGFTANDLHAIRGWYESLRAKTIDIGEPLSPRVMLQTLGTEFGRTVNPAVWSEQALRTSFKLLGGGHAYTRHGGLLKDAGFSGKNLVVIPDGRFRNEILAVSKIGGLSLKLVNPQEEAAPGVAGHASEAQLKGIPASWYSAVHKNDKKLGLQALKDAMFNLFEWAYT